MCLREGIIQATSGADNVLPFSYFSYKSDHRFRVDDKPFHWSACKIKFIERERGRERRERESFIKKNRQSGNLI